MRLHGRNLVLLGALLAPLAVAAQGGPGPGGMMDGPGGMMGRPGARAFDPSTVTTIQGRIAAIERVDRGHRHQGVHLAVTTGSETLPVLLGPDFYVDAQPVKLAAGDEIEVKGSRLTLRGRAAILAQEVRRGGEVLALRDANGVPLWRGQGMRRR